MSDTSVYQSGRPRRSTTQYDLSEKMEEEEASLAPTLKRQRGSRTLHRKTDHSVIERRRREKINDRLLCLQETVPACREKAFEHFKKKPCPHGTGTSAERIGSEMVLEKLCIISHTVDYVMELRKQLEAYRAMCTCEPEIPSPNEHTEEHAQFAHDGQPRTCTRSPNEDSLSPTPVKDEAMPIKEESKSLKLERKKHRTPDILLRHVFTTLRFLPFLRCTRGRACGPTRILTHTLMLMLMPTPTPTPMPMPTHTGCRHIWPLHAIILRHAYPNTSRAAKRAMGFTIRTMDGTHIGFLGP
ncbi:hypothetical protein MVES_003413 [Malassezia vespertilionis]|uniref:BHLH domain-containing protein n=1 Tax=Malassezia vespertilionis TaxID=2020962 RepID=A0A2N1J7R9_9BASI|nr:hypothetical protein MVES_003413 [Malassezia vespertilionis]